MDKIKAFLVAIIPGLIISSFSIYDHFFGGEFSKNIVVGLIILFPIIFIVQGILSAPFKKLLVVGLIISSLSVILPIEIFYNMAGVMESIIFYIILGVISFTIKTKLLGKRLNTK